MTDRQEDHLTMYDEVINYSDANTAATASIAAYGTTLTAFKAVVTNIRDTDAIAEEPTGGLAVNKSELKVQVAEEGASLCKAIKAYAVSINNSVLEGKVKYTKSDLKGTRDEVLPDVLNNISTTASSLIPAPPAANPLEPYGVDTSRLTAFDALITLYSSAVPSTRDGIVNRKTANQQLVILDKQADDILRLQLDGLAQQVGGSFYQGYLNARIIVDSPTEHSGFKGTITDANTGVSLVGIATGKAQSPTETYTATFNSSTNLWTILTPKFKDEYALTFNAPGYQMQQTSNRKTKRGVKTNIDIVMTPIS